MLRYESLILTTTQLTADELSLIEKHFDKVLSDCKGKVLSFDKWGKFRLAYPIAKNDYGIYILIQYEIPSESTTKVSKNFSEFLRIKCNEFVLRHVTVGKKLTDPIVYKRPESVDANRPASLDEFLKENKMETFLNSGNDSSNSNENDSDNNDENIEG